MRTTFRPLALAGVLAGTLAAGRAGAYTAGHIFVTNRGGNNVLELDNSLKLVKSWFGAEGLSAPNGMAFDAAGNLYVADTENDRIIAFDKDGTKIKSWSTFADLGTSVESIAFDKSGRLFATANPGTGRVVSYAADGTGVKTLVDDPVFLNLGNVNFSRDGNVLLSDFSSTRGVRELDPKTGKVLKEFGVGTSSHEDMILDGSDNLFVSGFNLNTVLRFDPARKLVTQYKPTGLSQPTGIVLTSDCRLIVASYETSELFVLKWDGTFLKKYSITGMGSPESLAISALSVTGAVGLASPVPVCDGSATVDAGVDGGDASVADATMDAGAVDSGAIDAIVDSGVTGEAAADTGPQTSDAGVDSREEERAGCRCRFGTGRGSPMGLVPLFAVILVRRRRRAGPR